MKNPHAYADLGKFPRQQSNFLDTFLHLQALTAFNLCGTFK
ncbi:hypothetical protein Lysil_2053 [Lysobacter silvestris]|uniref:Uncharacterized protein n=1 Tax=Solilutibacter silvestris TaxID=1645665 RepID=A0A2K1PYX4_9GAMM|nr:hypothetical protein Lysil_2053 [Lysobacter silvestris]